MSQQERLPDYNVGDVIRRARRLSNDFRMITKVVHEPTSGRNVCYFYEDNYGFVGYCSHEQIRRWMYK